VKGGDTQPLSAIAGRSHAAGLAPSKRIAHDEGMGQACERCGKPGKSCSITDAAIRGKWKIVTLCDQCHAAIRQLDARAWKWFRRYCANRK